MRILSRTVAIMATLCSSSVAARADSPWLLPNFSDRVEMQVRNPHATSLRKVIVLSVRDIGAKAPSFPGTFAIAMQPGESSRFLPMQVDDMDGDGKPDEVAVQVEVPAQSSTPVQIYYSTTLRDSIPWPHQVHASHAYGYNTATATIESTAIGYRTYGGFLFDVQAHRAGQVGLFNSLLGYSRTGLPPREGRDVVHYGQTLGLGGLYLRQGDVTYRPPFNTPTYTHKAAAIGEPTYRVLTDGPVRAVILVDLPEWQAGENRLAVQGIYEMHAGEEVLRAELRIHPEHMATGVQLGTGVLTLPGGSWRQTEGTVLVTGTQEASIGALALGVGFEPDAAHNAGVIRTPGGDNRVVQFTRQLKSNDPAVVRYTMAAAWSGGGAGNLLDHLQQVLHEAGENFEITSVQHAITPTPRTLEGEPL